MGLGTMNHIELHSALDIKETFKNIDLNKIWKFISEVNIEKEPLLTVCIEEVDYQFKLQHLQEAGYALMGSNNIGDGCKMAIYKE